MLRRILPFSPASTVGMHPFIWDHQNCDHHWDHEGRTSYLSPNLFKVSLNNSNSYTASVSSGRKNGKNGQVFLCPIHQLRAQQSSTFIFGCLHLWALRTHIWMFPKIMGKPPKSSILTRFSIINHPFWGTPIFGNTHIYTQAERIQNVFNIFRAHAKKKNSRWMLEWELFML